MISGGAPGFVCPGNLFYTGGSSDRTASVAEKFAVLEMIKNP